MISPTQNEEISV